MKSILNDNQIFVKKIVLNTTKILVLKKYLKTY